MRTIRYMEGIPEITPRELTDEGRYGFFAASHIIQNKHCWTTFIQKESKIEWVVILETTKEYGFQGYQLYGPFKTEFSPSENDTLSPMQFVFRDLENRKVPFVRVGPFNNLAEPNAIELFKMGFGAPLSAIEKSNFLQLELRHPAYEPEIFGIALKDQMEGKDVVCKVQRDDGLIAEEYLSEYLLPEAALQDYDRALLEIIKEKIPKGKKILDIGAGGGRHSIALQNAGYDILAIDKLQSMVDICLKRGVLNARKMDIKELGKLDTKFDAFLMLGNNLGIAGTMDNTIRLMGQLAQIANQGALLVGTTKDPLKNAPLYHSEYHTLNMARGRYKGQLRLRVQYNNKFSSWFDLLFMPYELAKQLTEAGGWTLVKSSDSSTDRSLPPNMLSLVFSKG
ncbi:MAG: methyltransferase domain-containing protein [Candidatus Coatesbacteria bacterium]|nr:methyltransferase domain-containing protein [Candidatus Coatesbacteria bacterium]